MNILILCNRYPYKNNMIFVFVKKIVDEWAKKGNKCVVISPFSITTYLRKRVDYVPKHYIDEVDKEAVVDVYRPRYFSLPLFHVGGVCISQYLSSNTVFRQLKKIDFTPDVIYCHFFDAGTSGWYLSKRLNIPFIVASGECNIHPILKPAVGFEISTFKDDISGCVCVSTKNKEEALGLGYIKGDNCEVFPNATNLELFKKLDKSLCRKELGIDEKDFVVICVGYFIHRKGQDRVLEAVRLLNNPSIKLIFIGSDLGKENMLLESDCIIHKGSVKNNNLPKFLNASDVFCLPTLHEGCCNSIVEAMACGLPIVSSDRSFNYDILNKDNSIMVDPENVEEIAKALDRLYHEGSLRQRLGDNAHKDAQKLSVENRANGILSFIERSVKDVQKGNK